MSQTGPTGGEVQPFETQSEEVLRRVRGAFAEIMEALPGPITRPHQLQKALGIDKQLSWRILKATCESDPFAAAHHLPGPNGVKIFLDAAARNGVSSALMKRASRALAEFDELVDIHAGDRASIDMMMSAHAQRGREPADLAHRKLAFRGNSYLWGVQAKVQLRTDIAAPAREKGLLDICSLQGFIGLRRLRPDVPWVVSRGRCVDNDGQARRTFLREPLDARDREGGTVSAVPLLRAFCSKPIPEFRRIARHGFVEAELIEGPVGDTGAVTCITGEVGRAAASYFRDEHNRFGNFIASAWTPCETLIFDQIAHENIFGDLYPTLAVYSELGQLAPFLSSPESHRDLLPVTETVEYLGTGVFSLHTPHVPHYAQMARFAFERLGWDAERFKVYRLRMKFPIIPTSVVIRYDLPERPAEPE